MYAELPLLPLASAVLLSAFCLLRRVREDVAVLSMVAWLFACNLIHGVNAIVWAGNSDVNAPVWCDIATKLVLGAMISLPASCLCIMCKLELLASSRPFRSGLKARQKWIVVEIVSCIVVPILYMLEHYAFQDYRFNILQDYGCSASVYPATASVVLMWFPPLICCILTFILCGATIYHLRRSGAPGLTQHIRARTSTRASHFLRRLSMTTLITVILFTVIIFSLFAGNTNAKLTWALLRVNSGVIHTVTSGNGEPGIRWTWWGLRIVSIIFILLGFTWDEARDGIKPVRFCWSMRSSDSTHSSDSEPCHRPAMSLSSLPVPPRIPTPRSVSLDMRSGWDDTWEAKSPLRTLFLSRSLKAKSRTSLGRSTPSPSPTMADDAFLASALNHLGPSPTYAYGLNTPIIPAPPIHIPPRRVPSRSSAAQRLSSLTMCASTRSSRISSVFDAHWPQPPESSISPTPNPSRAGSVADTSRLVEEDSLSITAHEVSVEHAEMLTIPASPTDDRFQIV